MPIAIKTVNLKYKNAQGQYVGVNTVGETTTAEQIAAIEAKGEEVIESIPSDYSALTDEVGNMSVEEQLLRDELPGTTKQVVNGLDGNPFSVTHKVGETIVRTDWFTWGENTVTETRVLAAGKRITIETNLTTLYQTMSAIQEVV